MKDNVVAKRYAMGLFDLALESGEQGKLEADFLLINEVVRRIPAFIRTLEDERIPLKRRLAAAAEIARTLGLSEDSRNATLLLLARKRIAILGLVAKNVLSRIMAEQRLAAASARVADKSQSKEIRGKIEEILGQLLKLKVKCDVSVDPALIGGFVLRIGDMRYDASVAGELARMKESLLHVGAGVTST